MKTGELFEKTVALIEETLRTDTKCKVEHNVILKDNAGNPRQIDVLITYKPEDRFEFKIAVECKDWSRKVSVADIGEFVDRIKSLNVNKGIFVSKSGYQSGAVAKAKKEELQLYTLGDVTPQEIDRWISLKNVIITRIDQSFSLINYYLLLDKDSLKEVTGENINWQVLYSKHKKIFTLEFLTDLMAKHYLRRLCEPLYQQLNTGNKAILNQRERIFFRYIFEDEFFLVVENIQIPFIGIMLELDIWIFETIIDSFKIQALKDIEDTLAELISFQHGNKEIKFIKTKDKVNIFVLGDEEFQDIKYLKRKDNVFYDETLEDIFNKSQSK